MYKEAHMNNEVRCLLMRDLITLMLDDRLDEDRAWHVREHMRYCPACHDASVLAVSRRILGEEPEPVETVVAFDDVAAFATPAVTPITEDPAVTLIARMHRNILEFPEGSEADPNARSGESPVGSEAWEVAAASVGREAGLYTAVRDAAAGGSKVLEVRLEDGALVPLFRIIPEEQTVEPCVVEGRKVVVNLPQLGPQEVTPSGGMIIPWDELRNLRVKCLEAGKTIEIRD